MSTSSSDRVHQIFADKIVLAPSSLTGISHLPGQNAMMIKYGSGGSLEIGGITNFAGTTFAAGNGYLFSSGEVLSINCGAPVYVIATGATVTAFVIRTVTG